MTNLITVGMWVDGRQVQFNAPLTYVHADYRKIGNYSVKGNWSKPYWAYEPSLGWAIVCVWRSKVQIVSDMYDPVKHRCVYVEVPAVEEIVTREVGNVR